MEQKSSFEKFLNGISTQTIVSFTNSVLQLIVFAVLSRLLSKEDFGYYAILMGITSIFMSISDAGIGSAVIQKKELTRAYCSTSLTLSILFGALISILFILFSPVLAKILHLNDMILPLCLMSIPLILHSINGYATAILKRNLNFAAIGKYKIISYTISSIISIVYAYMGGGVYALLCLFTLDSILYTSFLFFNIEIPKLSVKKDETKKIINFGGWLSLGVIMSSISSQLDKVVLGRWLTPDRLGAYFRPSGFILNIISTISNIFDSVLFPILSRYQDSIEQFRNLLQKSLRILSSFGIILSMLFFFNSELIILIFFGEKWLDLKPILEITSFCAAFMLINTLADCFFRSFNLVKTGFFIRFMGVFISLFLLYEGAKYDIIGVAISIFISNVILVVIKYLYLSGKSGSKITTMFLIWIKSLAPAIPVIIVGSIFYFIPNSIVVQILKALVIVLTIVAELIIFPNLFGEVYTDSLYPKIKTVLKKK